MNKKLIFGVCFDILVISASCFFSSILTNTTLKNINLVLGMMTIIKILTNFFFKSYRKSWTYISLPDLNGYILSGFIGSLISFILINNAPSIEMLGVEFFIIDFILTFSGVLVTRIIFKYFRETILRYRNFDKRILIYGAGEKGNLLSKYLLSNTNLNMKPIGFIDDDKSLHEIIFNGIPVLGGHKNVNEICNYTKVHEIIVASEKIPDSLVIALKEALRNSGIKIIRFQLGFEEIITA